MTRKNSSLYKKSLSERIKEGIRRAQAEGKIIGAQGAALAGENRKGARARAQQLRPIVEEFERSGLTYREMVVRLNARGEAPPSGRGQWQVRALRRLVDRVRRSSDPGRT